MSQPKPAQPNVDEFYADLAERERGMKPFVPPDPPPGGQPPPRQPQDEAMCKRLSDWLYCWWLTQTERKP